MQMKQKMINFAAFFSKKRQSNMERKLDLFKIRKEERWPALVALLYFVALNSMMVIRYGGQFSKSGSFWENIVKGFIVSGFDPYVDLVITRWRVVYALFRHPLMSAYLYPFSLLNDLLRGNSHDSYAVYIAAVLYTVLSLYSFVWLFRTLRHVVGVRKGDAYLLTAFFYSFASIMLTVFVPDHFAMTLFFLTLTLYMAGTYMKRGQLMKWWQTASLLFLSSGITLTNCVKMGLADLFVNRRHAFSPRHILLAYVLPLLLLFGGYQLMYHAFYLPEHEKIEVNELARAARDKKFAKRLERDKKKEEARRKRQVVDSPYFMWTDKDLPRLRSVVENLFGESIQLHQDHLLGDVNRGRPVFVAYDYKAQYAVVFLVMLLFVAGIVAGWRERFLWMVLSWFAYDMVIHLGFGFGLTEVSIMGAHWLFAIPIAVAFLMRRIRGWLLWSLRAIVCLTALYLMIYNGWLIAGYMLFWL